MNLQAARLPLRKGVVFGMLPRNMSMSDRFRVLRDAGFEEVECYTTPDEGQAEEIKKAAEANKIRIHSVMNQAHWKFPLSSPDPAVVAESMKGMETSLRNAKFWGAETVLLVPAVVNPETGYKDAWVRSQQQVRKLLPMAAELKVVIAVENVGNKFLLSPLEFAQYVDEFKSPWLKAYFDVGNNLRLMYPQDWIRTLGKRIVKLHFKGTYFQVKPPNPARQQQPQEEIDWKEVVNALKAIGYRGSATLEIGGGDEAYLREVSRRFDAILAGA